jgi:hypothetical protein
MTQQQFETALDNLGLVKKSSGNYVFRVKPGDDSIFSDGLLSINIEYCYDDIFMFYPDDISQNESDNIITAFKQHKGWEVV